MSIKIYADPITVNCRKVIAGLDFIGAPYELIHVDYFKGEHKAEPYLSLNPNASARVCKSRGYAASLANLSAAYCSIAFDSHSSKSPSVIAGTEALGLSDR